MANVLNPETESITLNTELETPTLDPATELERPLYESTSNPESTSVVETAPLDADALTEPVAQAATLDQPAPSETLAAAEPEAIAATPEPPAEAVTPPVAPSVSPAAQAQVRAGTHTEPADDFSEALAAFEREQAAEAAAVEAYGDKIVSGKVEKQTEKYLVIDVGLKSEGLIPIDQVLDHTGAVKFQPGDVIDVVIEREEPEGDYLVSYEKAQRLRVWDTIEKAANDKTPVTGTVVSRVKGGLTVDIGMKAFLPGSQLEIRPVRNLDTTSASRLKSASSSSTRSAATSWSAVRRSWRKSRIPSVQPPWSTSQRTRSSPAQSRISPTTARLSILAASTASSTSPT